MCIIIQDICNIFFIHPNDDGHLLDSIFWHLWTMLLLIYLIRCVCVFWECAQTGDCWSYCKFISSFLRYLHTVSHYDCSNFLSHHQCARVLFSPRPWQHLLLYTFWISVILMEIKRYFLVVLNCKSLVTIDVEHFSTYLLVICISSFKNCLLLISSITYFYVKCTNFTHFTLWI